MGENKIYYIVNHGEYLEIVIRSILLEKELYDEINFILSIRKFNTTVSFPQLISTKIDNDHFKLEIQMNLDASEKDDVVGIINGVKYKLISN